jgi:hypothetical protein
MKQRESTTSIETQIITIESKKPRSTIVFMLTQAGQAYKTNLIKSPTQNRGQICTCKLEESKQKRSERNTRGSRVRGPEHTGDPFDSQQLNCKILEFWPQHLA